MRRRRPISKIIPMRATPRGPIAIARKNPPGPVTCDVTQNMKYAPSIYRAPWAKFKMLSTPKIRVRPDDMRNRNAASRRADKTCTVRKEMSRKPVMPLLRKKKGCGPPCADGPLSRPGLLVRFLGLLPLLDRVEDLVGLEHLGVPYDGEGIRLVEHRLPDHEVAGELVVLLAQGGLPPRGVDR